MPQIDRTSKVKWNFVGMQMLHLLKPLNPDYANVGPFARTLEIFIKEFWNFRSLKFLNFPLITSLKGTQKTIKARLNNLYASTCTEALLPLAINQFFNLSLLIGSLAWLGLRHFWEAIELSAKTNSLLKHLSFEACERHQDSGKFKWECSFKLEASCWSILWRIRSIFFWITCTYI